ncbi:unnamed protein product [Ectocarpus sp. 8 AP-2014]
MAFSVRGGHASPQPIPDREISRNIADMEMGSWISSLLRSTLRAEGFADNDFMGQGDDIVSVAELVETMAFYATTMGYSPAWEQTPSPTFDNFARRPGVYKKLLKKIDNWSTPRGGKKLSSAKKVIRIRVSDKMKKIRVRPDSLGVFDDSRDMASIYRDADHKSVIHSLHLLGKCPEEDPRFYIHMVYRYYMNEYHKQLADEDKVLRFPSIQKILDITKPIDCVGTIPAEFRTFVKSSRGTAVSTVTIPVPSKTKANEVVYTYNFESAVPWVPVMRAMVFDLFMNLNSRDTSHSFREIYPKYLIKGDGGCEKGNKAVVTALARSIEMKDLVHTLHSLQGFQPVSIYTKDLLDGTLSIDSRVAAIFPRYNSHPFLGEGEQLHERLGFLHQDSVRGVFRRIASKMSSFCNDIYSGLKIEFKTIEVFKEYCTTKTFMTFKRRDESVWRQFIVDTTKICCILHAWSRKSDVDEFVKEHGCGDRYLCRILEGLV